MCAKFQKYRFDKRSWFTCEGIGKGYLSIAISAIANWLLTARRILSLSLSHSNISIAHSLTHSLAFALPKLYFCMGSGCGSVGRAVAFNTRGPWFDSSHRQNFIEYLFVNLFFINCIKKTKINKKRPGMAHLKNRLDSNTLGLEAIGFQILNKKKLYFLLVWYRHLISHK